MGTCPGDVADLAQAAGTRKGGHGVGLVGIGPAEVKMGNAMAFLIETSIGGERVGD